MPGVEPRTFYISSRGSTIQPQPPIVLLLACGQSDPGRVILLAIGWPGLFPVSWMTNLPHNWQYWSLNNWFSVTHSMFSPVALVRPSSICFKIVSCSLPIPAIPSLSRHLFYLQLVKLSSFHGVFPPCRHEWNLWHILVGSSFPLISLWLNGWSRWCFEGLGKGAW